MKNDRQLTPTTRWLRDMLLLCLLSALHVVCSGEFAPTGHSLHINDGNFSSRDHMESFQHRQVLDPPSGSNFNLKVQVNDILSHQQLSQAVVEVYINYSRTLTVLTGEDGSVLLHVPYQALAPVTVVASKDGYICTLLTCTTNKLPIFSSVTMSLLGLNQGNIWLFEDSVLITGKSSDTSLPVVQFPKSLLNLTDSSNFTSVKAFLTFPKLPSERDSFQNTFGILTSKSGYINVELTPVAAVSVQLFSGDIELHVNGPIWISLSVPDTFGLQNSSVVPAWFFNWTTGGWMRKGLGTVVSVEGRLTWTFLAPHLGYWIAAPLSSTRGFFGLDTPIDLVLQHSSFLLVILGGMLLIVICLLLGIFFSCRCSISEAKTKRVQPVMRKDQTTSTCEDEVLEVSSGELAHPQDDVNQSFKESGENWHNVIANPGAVAVTLECNGLENTDLNDLMEHIRVPTSLTENLFFYSQPLTLLQAPAFFHLEEEPEQPPRSKSATLPRADAKNSAVTEPPSNDNFTHSVSKRPPATQNQAVVTELPKGSEEEASTNTSRAHCNLSGSVLVPGTLNKIRARRLSVHAVAELSEIPSLQPPRAWFVSLEGKPAAEIHYAVSEQQRRRRPVESRETSLDSGVDMSELSLASGRRAVTLERNATFVKSTSSSRAPPQ